MFGNFFGCFTIEGLGMHCILPSHIHYSYHECDPISRFNCNLELKGYVTKSLGTYFLFGCHENPNQSLFSSFVFSHLVAPQLLWKCCEEGHSSGDLKL